MIKEHLQVFFNSFSKKKKHIGAAPVKHTVVGDYIYKLKTTFGLRFYCLQTSFELEKFTSNQAEAFLIDSLY